MLLILGLDILISLEKKQILTGEKFNQSIDRLRLVYEPEISVANVECKKEHSQAHGQTAEYVCHIDDRQLQPLDFVFVYRVVGHFFFRILQNKAINYSHQQQEYLGIVSSLQFH